MFGTGFSPARHAREHASKSAHFGLLIALLVSLLAANLWPATAHAVTKRSIREWVDCGGGITDDTDGTVAAFAAAQNNAFTLVIDCPVHLRSGMAIDRVIFIDNGTQVEFTSTGKFFIDNLFHPQFVIANSHGIHLTNWNVEWDGIVPFNPDVRGYVTNNKFVGLSGILQPASMFNDITLSTYLSTKKGVKFDLAHGWVSPIWMGAVNASAVFYLTGDTYDVSVVGLNLYAPPNVTADHFMAMAFSMSQNWKNNQTVFRSTPYLQRYVEIPHDLTFQNIKLDGTLMGWQGNARSVLFEDITSLRYADCQAANGGYSGGKDKWFPPPHLFYMNYNYTGDTALYNRNLRFETVHDLGPRLGTARDHGNDGYSGYALSLKLGCHDCSVNNYTSNRLDGFMDVLPSYNLTVTNVTATFDSKFLNFVYPAGIRFPLVGYSHLTFDNIHMIDDADYSLGGPIGHATDASNVAINFSNVKVDMKSWAGSSLPMPTISGSTNSVQLDFTIAGQATRISHLQKNTVIGTLQANPMTVRVGGSTQLRWAGRNAASCTASGAWSGGIKNYDTRVVKVTVKGNNDYVMRCVNGSQTSVTTVRVVGM